MNDKAFFIPQVSYERLCRMVDMSDIGILPGVRLFGRFLTAADPDFGEFRVELFDSWFDCAFYLGQSASQLYTVEIGGDEIYVRPSFDDEVETNNPGFTGFWRYPSGA